jgi:hypothetical protein
MLKLNEGIDDQYRQLLLSEDATSEGDGVYSMVIDGQTYRSKVAFGDSPEKVLSRLAKKGNKKKKVEEGANDDHIVAYDSPRTGENPFTINGVKWQYVNAVYPDGKKDIAVYRFDHDYTYDYSWFMDNIVASIKPASE